MYYERLNEICRQHGTTPTALLKKIGLSTSKVTAWKNGALPKMNTIELLAKELGVPISVFFSEETPKPLPDEECELLEVYRQLTKSGKRQLLGKAYELLDTQPQQHPGEEVSPPNVSVVTAVHNSGIKK